MKIPNIFNCEIAVIGLGYVGLPLALELATAKRCVKSGKKINRRIIGFDINEKRIIQLKKGVDYTNECDKKKFQASERITFTSNTELLQKAEIFIITVPTPVDSHKNPDLLPLKKASETIGKILKLKFLNSRENTFPVIIYESTVYPGATEEECIPIIESFSGLLLNKHFFCGYSPERINPGDPNHKLTDIKKVTSGSNELSAGLVNDLYASIIKNGTHKASSIKVAEAAKVIENTQRDVNIALVNELAKIFKLLKIDTFDVLEAASTKWNFLNFKPGLVGGHCIGVDPYYLTYKAEQVGYKSEVVLAGRRMNDSMPEWVAQQIILEMAKRAIEINSSRILVAGITFKENCPDLRNSKVFDLINFLKKFNIEIDILDPWVNSEELSDLNEHKINKEINIKIKYSAVVITVAHDQFKNYSSNQWGELLGEKGFFYDLKNIIPKSLNPIRF